MPSKPHAELNEVLEDLGLRERLLIDSIDSSQVENVKQPRTLNTKSFLVNAMSDQDILLHLEASLASLEMPDEQDSKELH
jgi:hypothetical protein